jgi:hypothetical protein
VVHLKVLHRPASLASPTVAFQNSLAECCVGFRIEAQTWLSLSNKNGIILRSPLELALFPFTKTLANPR